MISSLSSGFNMDINSYHNIFKQILMKIKPKNCDTDIDIQI